MDSPYHRRGKNLLARIHARHLQAMTNICAGLLQAEGLQVIARRDPLVELPQLRAPQHLGQFGLADQDDLQQFLAVGFQVCQQADLLQHVEIQVLRLIDQQNGFTSAPVILQQVAMQAVGERLEGVFLAVVGDTQLIAHGGKQFHRVESGVENDGDIGIVGQLFQQAPVDGGLASADFPGEQDEPPARTHTVQQVCQSVPVSGAHEQVARVYRYGKGRFNEPEILVVHAAGSQYARICVHYAQGPYPKLWTMVPPGEPGGGYQTLIVRGYRSLPCQLPSRNRAFAAPRESC